MRKIQIRPFLPALLCAAALLTFACNRGEENQAGQVSNETQPPSAQASSQVAQPTAPPPTNELQPPSKSVDVQEETPPATNQESADLRAREHELAARQADLDARERRLREREQQAHAAPPAPSRHRAPAPKPAPRREETQARSAETAPAPAAPAPAPVPEPARETPRHEEPAREEPVERTTTVTVPAGKVLDVEFTKTLASNTSASGESFRARVAHDIEEDGEVVIPAGSEILGEVTEAVPLRKVGGQAKLALRFTDLVLPSGATVPIDASLVQQGRSETGKDAAAIGGSAAAGAVLGHVLGKGNRSKGAVIGAIIGAAAGTVIASRTPGEEVVIPQGSVVSLKLDESVRVKVTSRR
jgi:type IV secretory pathway VirB10-like protein